jgi:hypothetical protein
LPGLAGLTGHIACPEQPKLPATETGRVEAADYTQRHQESKAPPKVPPRIFAQRRDAMKKYGYLTDR